jgi:hypothetical protein
MLDKERTDEISKEKFFANLEEYAPQLLSQEDLEVLFLKYKKDYKTVSVLDFVDKLWRAIEAILLEKLRFKIEIHFQDTGIPFKAVFEKYDKMKS